MDNSCILVIPDVSHEVHEFIVNNYATMLQEKFWVIPKNKENVKALLKSLDR